MEKNIQKHSSAVCGKNFQHGYNIVICQNVKMGDNVFLGNNVVIHPDTVIGDNVTIFDNAVLGRPPKLGPASNSFIDPLLGSLILGSNVTIGTASIVYRGTKINSYSYIADMVHIREGCQIGSYCSVGKCSSLEPKVIMEDKSKIAACSQIAALTELKKGCFVGADVSICTDKSFGRIKNADQKVVIEEGAMVGSNASIGPGVRIGKNAMVALGSVVLKNVPENKVAFGNPARIVWNVDKKLQIGIFEKGYEIL